MRIPNLPSGGLPRLGTRRASAAVALDIGADAVVALPPGSGDGRRVCQAIVHPLPVGLVVDGEVVNPDGLAHELSELFHEHGLPRDVRVGLAHPRLMVRVVELPATLDGPDLDGAVRHLAADLLPVGLDQLVVDYRRVGAVPGAGESMQRILIGAARVDGIDRLMRALDTAGLRADGIALSGLAMLAAFDHSALPGEAILYVQAGALTNVVISEDGEPVLVRAASAGSESIATSVAERAGITHEAARAHISSRGLGAAPTHPTSSPLPEDLDASIAQQVREGIRRVVAEVQSSRGVYSARPDACPIGGVVLTGSMTTWPGVAQALEDELNLPVIVAGRGNWPQIDGLGVEPERLDVVVGLAKATTALRPDLRPGVVRSRRVTAPPPPIVAKVGGAMVAVAAATVMYLVVISNQVSSDREQLGKVSADLVTSEAKAASLKQYDDFAKATTKRHDAVATVAKTRFKWDRTMTELARVAPDGVWLTAVKGTLTPTTQIDGGAGGGSTSGLRAVLSSPAVELAGCAAKESRVPSYIDRLHLMTGVTDVGFSRTERTAKSGAAGAVSACQTTDSKSSSFELVTYFKQQSAPLAAGSTTTPAAGATPPATTNQTTAPSNQTAAATTGGS